MKLRDGLLFALSLAIASPALAGPVEDAAELSKKGKKAEAVALLEKAAEKAPKDCALAKALGDAYFEANDADMGGFTYERFLKTCGTDMAAKEVAGKLAKHFDAKVATAPEATNVREDKPVALHLVPLPELKARGGGTDDDRWAAENDSRINRLPAVDEAIEHMRNGKHQEAVVVLEGQVKKKPGDEQAWRYLGTARAKVGDRAGAIVAYQKYLQLAPKAPDAEAIRRTMPASALTTAKD